MFFRLTRCIIRQKFSDKKIFQRFFDSQKFMGVITPLAPCYDATERYRTNSE